MSFISIPIFREILMVRFQSEFMDTCLIVFLFIIDSFTLVKDLWDDENQVVLVHTVVSSMWAECS